MRRGRFSIAAVVLAGIALGVPGEALAEVSARRERDRVHTMIFSDSLQSIADDPDPIPSVRWEPLSLTPVRRPLNPTGDLRPDGAPHVAFHPITGWPVVVWAYNNGIDHDIAYARWTGDVWSDVLFVTSSIENERDPEAVVAADGTVHVVWWVDDAEPKVMTTSVGPVDSSFTTATRVSSVTDHAARPSVAIAGGSLWIAYERVIDNATPGNGAATSTPVTRAGVNDDPFAFGADASSDDGTSDTSGVGGLPPVASQVIVDRTLANGEYERALTIDSTRPSELDVEIHAHAGRLWIDWKRNDTQFGYADADTTGWNAPRAWPWSDPSWIGQEDVRQSVRRSVLQSPDTATVDPTE